MPDIASFRARMTKGEKFCGAWAQLGSPATTEILAQAGFDFLLIDMEHGPGDHMTLGDQLRACNGTQTACIVRVPWNDHVAIKKVLDIGAHGVLVPYVQSAEEAAAAVAACKYPPLGVRGAAKSPRAGFYGLKTDAAMAETNDNIFVMAAVETMTAVADLARIIATPGLDAIFLGPYDLATSMGYQAEPNHPEVLAVRDRVLSICAAANMPLASVSPGMPQAGALFDKGFSMLTLMADGVSLAALAAAQTRTFQKEYR